MTTPTPAFEKEIVYDRETRDFALYLDGQFVGFARTYQEGEERLNNLVYELLSEEYCAAADLTASECSDMQVAAAEEAMAERGVSLDVFDDLNACEACGLALDADGAYLLNNELVCAACYTAQPRCHCGEIATAYVEDDRAPSLCGNCFEDVAPTTPALTSCAIQLPDGSYLYLDSRGMLRGSLQTVEAA